MIGITNYNIAESQWLNSHIHPAHHLMGGELPVTGWQGLLAGLGHPIIGIDHFAFIVGVGLMSHLVGRRLLLPFLFVLGTVLGCYLHVQSFTLPWSEVAVALTVAAAAAIVAMRNQIPTSLLAALFVAAGIFHGYAYGESIVGAERAPLAAYVIGLGVIQYGIAVGSGAALRSIIARNYMSETMALRLAAGGIALAAILAFVNVVPLG